LQRRLRPDVPGRLASCSFVKRLIDRHRSHMKTTGTNDHGVSNRWLSSSPLEFLVTGVSLILDHSDVSRGLHWCYFPFGCLGQLFELTFLPASLEGPTP
jgi:hypothetical protein